MEARSVYCDSGRHLSLYQYGLYVKQVEFLCVCGVNLISEVTEESDNKNLNPWAW